MDNYIPTLFGVSVSIILFLLGYRQTVGAKKERVRAADVDVEKTLLRRVVLDAYKPTINEIVRLIDGKARDYRVRVNDLLTPSQFLATLFTRIVENDFLTPEQRDKILERINPVLLSIETKPPEIELIRADENKKGWVVRQWPLSLMAILTSTIGALASLPTFQSSDLKSTYLPVVLMIFGASLGAIFSFLILQRIKEKQEEPRSVSPLDSAVAFEEQVAKVLRESKLRLTIPPRNRNWKFDYLIEVGGKTIILDVKAWSRRPPLSYLRDYAFRLQGNLKHLRAGEAIVVTKEDIGSPEYILGSSIRLMPFKTFRAYLAESKT